MRIIISMAITSLLAGCGVLVPYNEKQTVYFDNKDYSIRASVTSIEAIRQYRDVCILRASIENYGNKDYSGGFAEFMLVSDDKDSSTAQISFSNGLVAGGKPHIESWAGWWDRNCPKIQRGTVKMYPR